MLKNDKTTKIHVLLCVLGFVLVLLGLININKFTPILTTVGGVFFGVSVSWIVEEYYKKSDERRSALELFNKAIVIFENAIKSKEALKEGEIVKFRKKPLHFYYSTKSEDGRLYWNYVIIDFTIENQDSLGELKTIVEFRNLNSSESLNYEVSLVRKYVNDNIFITMRKENSKEPIVISILDSFVNESREKIFGFSYHDDWQNKWRISPTILSFRPVFSGQKQGACTKKQCSSLQSLWDKGFLIDSNKSIFEKFQ